jgi:hypothetical protein
VQVRTLVLARGVLSSSEPMLHFGLGEDDRIGRLTVSWPSGHTQVFANLLVDRKFTITETSEPVSLSTQALGAPGLFADVSRIANFAALSRETPVDELVQQRLLPMRQNRRGPGLAVGDLNGDDRDDVVIGGTPADPTRALVADAAAHFESLDCPALVSESRLNDGPVLVFDADGDGVNDVLVTKAGTSQPAGAADYQPRLFLNDGKGNLRRFPSARERLLRLTLTGMGGSTCSSAAAFCRASIRSPRGARSWPTGEAGLRT